MKKCLYVSDLDGTLLRSDETISAYTCDVINRLTESGRLFSYATARSYVTAKKVTKGLDANIPVIVYNGTFVIDNVSEEILISNFFQDDIKEVLADLFSKDIYPIVYSYIDMVEYFSFIPDKCNKGMRAFLNTRKGDRRWREADNSEQLIQGNIFYITCIDSKEKLEPFFEKYKERYHVVFQQDIYTKEQWLEIMPREASKANAILQLKKLLGCEKVISFGDAANDIDMFNISDEAYAVANAFDELKQVATGVIGSNNDDGVAKWLDKNDDSLRKTPRLETDRLLLREIQETDVNDIFGCWMQDEDVSRYMCWKASDDIAETRSFVQYELGQIENEKWYRWIIVLKETGKVIGTCLVFYNEDDNESHWDISYNLGKKYWGNGYITEAMKEVMRFAENALGMEECITVYAKVNISSANVLHKLGFVDEAEIPYECSGGDILTEGILCRYVKVGKRENK